MIFDGEKELRRVRTEIHEEFNDFLIVNKENSVLMWMIDSVLRIVTLNHMRTYMTRFITTLGHKVYVPKAWFSMTHLAQATSLRHERVHMRQRRRMGRILWTLSYVFWVMPAFHSVGRRNLEMEAYEESMRAYAEYFGIGMLGITRVRENIIRHFVSREYFWTWPYKVDIELWYYAKAGVIVNEMKANAHGI